MKDTRQDIIDELNEMDSVLGRLEKQEPPVPEGYFEQTEQEILRKTIFAGKDVMLKRPHNTRVRRLVYATSIAAVFALVFFGMKFFNKENEQPVELIFAAMNNEELDIYLNNQMAVLTADDLQQYITSNIHDIETDLLAEAELIDEKTADAQIMHDVNLKILTDDENMIEHAADEQLIDEDLMKQINEKDIEELLNEESLFDDFAL